MRQSRSTHGSRHLNCRVSNPRVLHLNRNPCITDAAFEHFQTFNGVKGIHTLNVSDCTTITDRAFENLRGINALNMGGCRQITDKSFEKLRGIHTLNMGGCTKITDKGFDNLRGINALDMGVSF